MTPPTPWSVARFDVLDSTSDEARRRLIARPDLPPFLVRADRQTRGRGRGANAWWSGPGSLLFTLGFDPAAIGLAPRHEPRLALIAALAVIAAGRAVVPGLPAGIRWPNDVEVSGRKLAGVLPERVETEAGPRLLVGVGINVANRTEAAPPEIARMATSLAEQSGMAPDLDAVLTAFLAAFDILGPQLGTDDPTLPDQWSRLDLLDGRTIRVRQGETTLVGVGRGIAADGSLRVELDGLVRAIHGGQILRD